MAASRLASSHNPMPTTTPHVKPLALLPVADGSDELEVLTLYDVLTRGGVHVVMAAVGGKKQNMIAAMHGLKIRANRAIEDCIYDRYDLIVLPGGLGSAQLRDCDLLMRMLKLQAQEKRWIAAIGSAPAVVLQAHDLLGGHATCHPSQVRFLGEQYIKQAVVTTGHCVTSQGPGTAMAFSMHLLSLLCGQDAVLDVAKQVLYAPTP